MFKKKNDGNGEKIFRYSIRKYHFGAASVAVAALMFFANGTVQAQTPDISPATESEVARTSDVISSSSDGAEALSEKTSGKNPNQLEPSTQGNQESSDKNKSLVKDSEEGKKENQAEAISIVVDKSLAQSAQTSLQALLANLTLDSMKELHARVEESLARAKAVLDNPNSSQEEVNAQVQVMKALTEEVNKALAGGLTSPAQLGEGGSATTSEVSPTPRRGRGRRGQLTPPAMLAPAENQEIKETTEEVTDYTNGQGSYPLSEKIHTLLQELKISTENPEQVQKLKEAYDKLNEALGQSENGLVNQEVFNAALEEYKKAVQLKNGGSFSSHSRGKRDTISSNLRVGYGRRGPGPNGKYTDLTDDRTAKNFQNNTPFYGKDLFWVAESDNSNIRNITVSGLEGMNLNLRLEGQGTRKAVLRATGTPPQNVFGARRIVVTAIAENGHSVQKELTMIFHLPKVSFDTSSEDLKGKANDKPIVTVRMPGNLPSSHIQSGTQVKAFLVRGGRNSDNWLNPHAEGYEVVAVTLVKTDGTAVFTPTDYRKENIGKEPLKAILAIVNQGTETPKEDYISPLSDRSIQATDPIDRDSAIQELEQAATTKRESFDRIDHLTEEEKAEAVKKVNEALKAAKSNVDAANTKAKVDEAKASGLGNIKGVSATAATHQAAIQELEQAATTKRESFDRIDHLTEEEKAEAVKKVNEALKEAKSNVDAANTKAKVDEAKASGLGNIKGVSATAATNANAKEELRRKAQEKKAELANIKHLTTEELNETNRKVEETLRKAEGEVDKAKDQTSVESAKNDGLSALDKILDDIIARINQGNSYIPGNGGNQAGSDSRGDTASQGDRPAPSGDGSQGDANNQDRPTTPNAPAHSGNSTNQATAPSAQQRGAGNATAPESSRGLSGSSVMAPARSRRSVAFAGGAQSSQEKQVDKSVLRDLIQNLETRLKDLDGIDQSVIDAAKVILGEGQAALRNADLTEAGLREITAKVKEALESLKGKQATKDEETKETSKEQGHLPYGTMIASLLALLGLLLFLIARRKKESELKKLTKELTKVLQESDLTSVDAKVLDQAREALAQAVAFLANEKESDHTEEELIEKLKAILAQLR
ncbi:DUF1542 domain-containing protein [Streptococcus sp. 1055]|uniref:DUF1542 domain-containing protein n=2 Tax=Streptococcus TaxID=1301 RepID=UPI001F03FDB9|nr:DUF1542 domain-containing protein [Streptococcus sp. 1055]